MKRRGAFTNTVRSLNTRDTFLCLMIGICLSNLVLQLIVQTRQLPTFFGEKQIIIFLDGMQIVE